MPKAGGTVVTLATGDRLSGIATDGTDVYWVAGTQGASSGSIMKVPVGGGTAITLLTRPAGPAHLAMDASSVYWIEQMQQAVMKMPLTGGAPVTVAIAVDATRLYWLVNAQAGAGQGAVRTTPLAVLGGG